MRFAGLRLPGLGGRGKCEDHARSDSFHAGDGDLATVCLDELFHDVEAEARAAASAKRLASSLFVFLEQRRLVFGADAEARVGDRHDQFLIRLVMLRRHDDHAILRRELERIADEVDHDLRQLLAIALNDGQVTASRGEQMDAGPNGGRLHRADRAGENDLEVERCPIELKVAGFDLGEVEKLVDEPHHSL